MKDVELKGIIPPIVTPMNDDEEQEQDAPAKTEEIGKSAPKPRR